MIKRLAIIPARGGSKRIKQKNIKLFCGKPIIYYSIQNAKKSKLFSKIHVSTNSIKIKNIAQKYGASLDFMRPNYLSKDNVTLLKVMTSLVKKFYKLGYRYDEVWLIMPCTPLIDHKDLINASRFFKKNGSKNNVISVSDYDVPIEWSYKIQKNGFLKPLYPKMINKDSKRLKKKYYDSGSFIIYNFNLLALNNNKNQYIGYKLPKNKAIDIDDNIDWNIAESIYKSKKYEK